MNTPSYTYNKSNTFKACTVKAGKCFHTYKLIHNADTIIGIILILFYCEKTEI